MRAKSKPLSCYLFSEDENNTQRVLNELSFGGGAINDTLMHLANQIYLWRRWCFRHWTISW